MTNAEKHRLTLLEFVKSRQQRNPKPLPGTLQEANDMILDLATLIVSCSSITPEQLHCAMHTPCPNGCIFEPEDFIAGIRYSIEEIVQKILAAEDITEEDLQHWFENDAKFDDDNNEATPDNVIKLNIQTNDTTNAQDDGFFDMSSFNTMMNNTSTEASNNADTNINTPIEPATAPQHRTDIPAENVLRLLDDSAEALQELRERLKQFSVIEPPTDEELAEIEAVLEQSWKAASAKRRASLALCNYSNAAADAASHATRHSANTRRRDRRLH